jgi:hypothetical protein
MNQAVITFTNSTARASAITSPVEGMVTYLADTDTYQFWNGSAWTNLVSSTVGTGNVLLNGAFEIWQRGTSVTTTFGYTADRWFHYRDGSGSAATISQQTFTPGAAPVAGYEGRFFYRFNQTTAGTGATENLIQNLMEDVRTLAGETATISFWAKADAARTIQTQIQQNFGSGGSSRVDSTPVSHSLTTSWARYTSTVILPSISGKTIGASSYLNLAFRLPLNTLQTIDIWGVQLEAGSTATAFRRNSSSLQSELAGCQRYFYRMGGNTINDHAYLVGYMFSSTGGWHTLQMPVQMRAIPSASSSAASTFYFYSGTAQATPTSIGFSRFTPQTVNVEVFRTSTTSGVVTYLQAGGTQNAFIDISAEL